MGLHFLFVIDSPNATTTVGVHEEEDVQLFPSTSEPFLVLAFQIFHSLGIRGFNEKLPA